MATLHIKDIPEELQRRRRATAVARDETAKALVERAIAELLEKLEQDKDR